MKTKYKYIEFKRNDHFNQVRWDVVNKPGQTLGWVEYYKTWGEFCFNPLPNTVLSPTCLRDIAFFLLEATSLKDAGK